MNESLAIHSVGTFLPEPQSVRELAVAAGGDVSDYHGWPQIRVGGADDHPATLASRALDEALRQAGISVSDLKVVFSTGMSREYLGSWSVAAEVMRLHGAPGTCSPLDISCGCLGTLWSLSLAQGWLAAQGGGYAAIVSGERLSDTVDRADNFNTNLWGYSDGASALVIGVGTGAPVLWRVASTGFSSHADYNGLVRVEYGGTRHPLPPEGASNLRQFARLPLSEVRDMYVNGYQEAFAAARKGTDVTPTAAVCNQTSPHFMPVISHTTGVPPERIVVTGNDAGHVGAADIGLGLKSVLDNGDVTTPLALCASTPFAFGAALLDPASADLA